MTRVLVDRYELGDEIGAGGMARVLAGYDLRLQRPVAIKLLHDSIAATGRDRFLREARNAASFNHPNAVAVYDTGRDDDMPFIVMELVEGASLAEVLEQRGRLPQDEAVAVTSQVLAALAAAHRRGLVHRDIKPGNILLPDAHVPRHPADEPAAKLTDFGIAKGLGDAASGLTSTGQVLGTPKYVAPEQVGGHAATPRSDVYSVGVLLYELLAGEPPFTGENPIAVALAHREDAATRLDRKRKGLDPGLVEVVHRALDKDPERRFHDAGELRAALRDPSRVPAAAAAVGAAGAGSTQPLGDATTTRLDSTGDGAAVADRTQRLDEGDAAAEAEERRRSRWPIFALVAALLIGLAAIALVWDGFGELDDEPEEPTDEEPEEEQEEPEEPTDEEPDGPAEPEAPDQPEPAPDDGDDAPAPPPDAPGEDDPPDEEEDDAEEPPAPEDPPPDDPPGQGESPGQDQGSAEQDADQQDEAAGEEDEGGAVQEQGTQDAGSPTSRSGDESQALPESLETQSRDDGAGENLPDADETGQAEELSTRSWLAMRP